MPPKWILEDEEVDTEPKFTFPKRNGDASLLSDTSTSAIGSSAKRIRIESEA